MMLGGTAEKLLSEFKFESKELPMTPNQYLLREQPAQPIAALVGFVVILAAALMLGFGVASTFGAGTHHSTHHTSGVPAPRR